jgi:hypothetical protein
MERNPLAKQPATWGDILVCLAYMLGPLALLLLLVWAWP